MNPKGIQKLNAVSRWRSDSASPHVGSVRWAVVLGALVALMFGSAASAQTSGSTTTSTPTGPPGSITGRVTAAGTGQPIAGICAAAAQIGGPAVTSAKTGADGTYTISGVAPGRYRLKFHDCTNNAFADQFFNNKSDAGSADVLTVAAGKTLSGINAVMTRTSTPTTTGTGTGTGAGSGTGTTAGIGGATKASGPTPGPVVSKTGLARTGRSTGLLTLAGAGFLLGGGLLLLLAGPRAGRPEAPAEV